MISVLNPAFMGFYDSTNVYNASTYIFGDRFKILDSRMACYFCSLQIFIHNNYKYFLILLLTPFIHVTYWIYVF